MAASQHDEEESIFSIERGVCSLSCNSTGMPKELRVKCKGSGTTYFAGAQAISYVVNAIACVGLSMSVYHRK